MWTEHGRAADASRRYLLVVYHSRGFEQFPPSWRYEVREATTGELVDEQIGVTDADVWCEAWGSVALLRSSKDARLEGAYQIGVTGY